MKDLGPLYHFLEIEITSTDSGLRLLIDLESILTHKGHNTRNSPWDSDYAANCKLCMQFFTTKVGSGQQMDSFCWESRGKLC